MKLNSKINLLLLASIAIVLSVMNLNAQLKSSPSSSQSPALQPDLQVATFAGGCFWCIESGFEKLPGVSEAISGYTGGHVDNPSYQQVSAGVTGHTEFYFV